MSPTTCRALVKDYCFKCSLAGVNIVADDTKHWSERFLWFGLIILSWYGSGILIIAAWDDFMNNPISFGVDTIYTDWKTKMPTVAICESSNDKQIYNVSDTIWTPSHLLDLEDVLKEIVYFRGVSYTLLDICYHKTNPDPQCPTSNFSYYADLVRSDCLKVLWNCSYNEQQFECCEFFQQLDTELGKCFIINSIQTKNPKPYPMVNGMKTKRGILRFDILIPSVMYTVSEDEVPTVTTLQSSTVKIKMGYSYQRHLTVRNIENDPLVSQTTVKQRACKFNTENEGGLYPYYSFSACNVLCRKKTQMNLCKCNDHFMLDTPEEERCNISGIACLHRHASHLTVLKPKWASRPGLACDCIPSCNETEITVIKDATVSRRGKKQSKKLAKVELVLAYLPSERFKRNVVRSRLDLVVSIGGATGLFLGASILSFVELIFYFTVRFIGNIWIERHERNYNTESLVLVSNNAGRNKRLIVLATDKDNFINKPGIRRY